MTPADRGRALAALEALRHAISVARVRARDAETETAALLFRDTVARLEIIEASFCAELPPDVLDRAGGGPIRDRRQRSMEI